VITADAVLPGQLVAAGVSRSFGGAVALDRVDFDISTGEVVALLGENGAGKSTLVKILTGATLPDSGSTLIDGREVRLRSPREAQARGVAVVHQDYQLFPERSIAENIQPGGALPSRLGLVDLRRARETASALLHDLGVDIDVRRKAASLDATERKLVEIVRALRVRPRFLFLDEPTASLEARQSEQLLDLMRTLRDRGTGIVFITHKLGEVLQVTDRVVVLRDGRNVGEAPCMSLTADRLVRLIVGRDVSRHDGPAHAPSDVTALEIRTERHRSEPRDDSITVRAGEVVTLVGLVGSGVSELLRKVAGVDRPDGVGLLLDGKPVSFKNPAMAAARGVAYIPGDRKAGLFGQRSVAINLAQPSMSRYARSGLLNRRLIHAGAEAARSDLDIRCRSVKDPVGRLSGGNQQKVLVGRWFAAGISVLVVEEPTQGVDVAARKQIHQQILDFAAGGGAVLMATPDLDEARELSHRLVVLHAGRVSVQFDCHVAGPPPRGAITSAMAGLAWAGTGPETTERGTRA
jgi:ABC-type sugar transport system ATPase subunit